MRTRMYGGVRGRKTKVGGKPTFVFLLLDFGFSHICPKIRDQVQNPVSSDLMSAYTLADNSKQAERSPLAKLALLRTFFALKRKIFIFPEMPKSLNLQRMSNAKSFRRTASCTSLLEENSYYCGYCNCT